MKQVTRKVNGYTAKISIYPVKGGFRGMAICPRSTQVQHGCFLEALGDVKPTEDKAVDDAVSTLKAHLKKAHK